MNQIRLDEILSIAKIEDQITALKVTSFPDLPKWADLEPQYDPLQHDIMSTAKFPPILNENGVDLFKRIPLGLQSLAVDRISQAMFSTPSERVFDYDKDSTSQTEAVKLFEQIYAVDNSIDASNIERSKQNNASCEIVSIWYTVNEVTNIKGLPAQKRLKHSTFSEMNGYKIWANRDDLTDELLVVSLEYKDSNKVDHFEVYVNGTNPQYISYVKLENWQLSEIEANPSPLSVYPVAHNFIKKPVWGGEVGTAKVNELESILAYGGFYVAKNSAPVFIRDMGDTVGYSGSDTDETSQDSKKIVDVGKGGSVNALAWENNPAAVSSHYEHVRNSFFEENQIPDTSFANMIKSNTSAENKELIFSDSKAKAIDLGGEWQMFFYSELMIVKKILSIIYPSFASDFEMISIKAKITPYSVKSRKENAEYIALGGASMSLATKVRVLGEVDDIDSEVLKIEEENSAQTNSFL